MNYDDFNLEPGMTPGIVMNQEVTCDRRVPLQIIELDSVKHTGTLKALGGHFSGERVFLHWVNVSSGSVNFEKSECHPTPRFVIADIVNVGGKLVAANVKVVE